MAIYLTEQSLNLIYIANEAALHTAKLRVELSQSRSEQRDYLKNVELARVLDKRAARKREKGEEPAPTLDLTRQKKRTLDDEGTVGPKKKIQKRLDISPAVESKQMSSVLNNIF